MEIHLVRATCGEAEFILNIQKQSFKSLLDKYQDMATNPGNETIEEVMGRLKQDFTYYYLIYLDNEIVGAIRVVDFKDKRQKKRISPLFILPQYWNRGFAQKAIQLVEEIHGNENWELETSLQEARNCHLYEKMGYHKTGKTEVINERLTLICYEK